MLSIQNLTSIFVSNSMLRSVGLDGMVTVQWKINALSGVDNSNTTFNSTSGILSFAAGVSRQILYLQVRTVSQIS